MESIAIIGIGCRLPGASDPESFWQLLQNGVDAIAEVPKDRWDIDAFYDPEPGVPGKMSTRWGGFLDQVDQFDPQFFGISPREVERMDPQQRLVLEVAWEAIENAGLAAGALSGTQTGVFMGVGNYDYCRILTKDINLVNAYDGTGNTLSITANRLSYLLNLRGPSTVIETACSSSLVALHFACRSLQTGESDLCLVGGASLMLSPEPFIAYSHARMMAPDGRCKTFDARADGYVRGEGCGMVVIKRLSDAVRDHDNILAVVQGTAINQDGLSNGLTAPNGPSQQAVIRQALKNAGVSPADISYVETHGTGTSLGDPIEVKSLKAVLMGDRQPDQPCWIGSAKTNIGHLEAASGIVGLIKVVLAMQHQEIPPHLHFEQLNPYISLKGTTFQIPTERQPWIVNSGRRLAGISAFGFGGTNCHVILEDFSLGSHGLEAERQSGMSQTSASSHFSITNGATSNGATSGAVVAQHPVRHVETGDRPYHILTLSAKQEKALRELAQRYADYLTAHPDVDLAEVCFTANTGRSHFDHRLAAVAESTDQLREQLAAFAAGREITGVSSGQIAKKRAKVAFLFTGQGAQYVGMGRQLYETQPVFKEALDRCDEILRPYLQRSLLSLLYPDSDQDQAAENTLLNETAYTQPALFALEYALAQVWKTWGIEPTAVIGHSVGEYAAACVAGVFGLEEGLKLIAERARLMQALPPDGEMVAVFASESQVQAVIEPYLQTVAIATINGPQNTVISGQREAMQSAIAALKATGLKTRKLTVSHAFHSPLMEPMLAEFEQVAATVNYAPPALKLVSNVTGEVETEAIATPTYWRDHVRQPVRFAASLETLHKQGYHTFVEIGPKPTLLGMGQYCLTEGAIAWLPSLSPKQADWQQMLQSLGSLYVQGATVNWATLDQRSSRRRLQLPTYPFQRQRYWVEFPEQAAAEIEKSFSPSAQTRITELLNQGQVQPLAQLLTQTKTLSNQELEVLPKLLQLLVKQNQQQQTATRLKDWLYKIEWQPQHRQETPPSNGHRQSGTWLAFADQSGMGDRLAQLPDFWPDRCFLIYPGETYQQQGDRTWTIDPANPDHFDRLLQEVTALDSSLQGIVHLWSLEASSTDHLSLSGLEHAQNLGVNSTLLLLQALERQKLIAPKLWLVTSGAVPVGDTLPGIAQSPLWGLGKVVALEYPDLWGGMIDLDPGEINHQVANDQMANNQVAIALAAELQNSQGEDHLAFRQGQRFVARLVPQQLPESSGVSFNPDGTYLITGGLGALGLKVAHWMVEQGAKQLVLTGRHGPSGQAQEALSLLEQAGAKILVAQADVSSQPDMVRVLAEIQATLPPLRGIVHAAGVPGYDALKEMEPQTLTAVLQPKVKGAWLLHQLTQEIKLDFFVNFSSISSAWGSKGQAHYAAANHFLDSLAHHRHSLGLPALSINWGPWAGGGMAIAEFQMWMSRMGVEGLQPEEAIATLDYLLGADQVHVTVANVNWSLFKGLLEARGKRPLLALLGEAPSTPLDHPAAEVTSVTSAAQKSEILLQLEAAAINERYALLVAHLQQAVTHVLKLSQLPDPQEGLFDLGMDSLMAIELVGAIRTQLQTDLPIGDFMQATNIALLANLLLKQLSPESVSEGNADLTPKVLDLAQEAVLDEAIAPTSATEPTPVQAVQSILLTGGSGFLGAFLLRDLLEQTTAKLYCLVRAADQKSAMRKLQQNLKAYGLWKERYRSKLIPIVGDLAQPQLGIAPEQFEQLATQIDVIYHNAAVLNFVYPYSALKSTNVLGTQEVLRLACHKKIKPLHYVSTDAVFDSSAYYGREVLESEPILYTEGIDLGYTQTKWVSEKLVTIARDRGLPVAIYRPPLIAGDSLSGTWNTDDFTCRFLKGCIQMGSMPDMNCGLTLVPVDYVSGAIAHLSQQPESLGQAFHLNNPHDSSWADVTQSINELGFSVKQVPYEAWEAQLIEIAGTEENALSGLLPFFLRRWSQEQLTFAGLGQRRVKLNCQETVARLANSSVSCARVDAKLLDTYFSQFVRSGFLDAPKVRL